MKKHVFKNLRLLFFASLFSGQFSAWAQVIKVDLNVAARKEVEVNEPGYFAWPVTEKGADSRTFDGVTITLKGDLSSGWYKAGVQSPFLARWVNDGVVSGGPVELIIRGLPEGKHTLLTAHNTFANPENHTFAPLDIYVDGQLSSITLYPATVQKIR